MTNLQKVKLLHTIVWLIEASAIMYVLITGILGVQNGLLYIAIFLVLIEVVILIRYKYICPLTIKAKAYTDNPFTGFDIYLPNWLAKHNKTIFSLIFTFGIVLHLYDIIYT